MGTRWERQISPKGVVSGLKEVGEAGGAKGTEGSR